MAQIKIINENGKAIYPGTIGEAVVVNGKKKKLSAVVEELDATDAANAKAIADETTRAKGAEGALDDLTTTEKGSLVGAVNEVKKSMESNKENIDAINATLEAGGSYTFYAAGRVKGSASPKFTKFYGSKSGLEAVLKHLRVGTIKDGKISHLGAAGRLTLADNGEEIAIDGTDGDVCVIADTTIYMLRGTADIDGEKYNMLGLGLSPFVVGGVQAKEIKPFFFSADYTVNTKLDGDTVTKAYCIYNENVAGSYQAKSSADTLFKQDMKPNGNGYPSQYVSAASSGEYARNKNTDTESNSPYMGLWYEWEEVWWISMYLELGTLDFTDRSLLGDGCINFTPNASVWADLAKGATSGVKIITSDGTDKYGGLMSQSMRIGASGSNIYNLRGFAGAGYYVFLEELVHLRIMDNVVKNGLTDYIGNEDAVFTDLGGSVITDGSVNISNGTGMTAGQYYITMRNVDGCKGLTDGVFTGVVNMYVLLEIADGVYLSDGTTDLTGGKAIFKFSLNVYRGRTIHKGMFTQLEGFYIRQTNPEGTLVSEMWSADNVENAPVIRTDTAYIDDDALTGVLKGMTKKYGDAYTKIQGWSKDMDYDVHLHAYKTNGANQHSYECGYIWNNASWGAPNIVIDGVSTKSIDANGVVIQGHSVVNASAGGCFANYGFPGRTLVAFSAFRSGFVNYAGALAGLVQQ